MTISREQMTWDSRGRMTICPLCGGSIAYEADKGACGCNLWLYLAKSDATLLVQLDPSVKGGVEVR